MIVGLYSRMESRLKSFYIMRLIGNVSKEKGVMPYFPELESVQSIVAF
jgi:hypothetical protein